MREITHSKETVIPEERAPGTKTWTQGHAVKLERPAHFSLLVSYKLRKITITMSHVCNSPLRICARQVSELNRRCLAFTVPDIHEALGSILSTFRIMIITWSAEEDPNIGLQPPQTCIHSAHIHECVHTSSYRCVYTCDTTFLRIIEQVTIHSGLKQQRF